MTIQGYLGLKIVNKVVMQKSFDRDKDRVLWEEREDRHPLLMERPIWSSIWWMILTHIHLSQGTSAYNLKNLHSCICPVYLLVFIMSFSKEMKELMTLYIVFTYITWIRVILKNYSSENIMGPGRNEMAFHSSSSSYRTLISILCIFLQ